MIRRPPRSTRTDTLFPYTTLFRSLRARPLHGEVQKARRALVAGNPVDRIAVDPGLQIREVGSVAAEFARRSAERVQCREPRVLRFEREVERLAEILRQEAERIGALQWRRRIFVLERMLASGLQARAELLPRGAQRGIVGTGAEAHCSLLFTRSKRLVIITRRANAASGTEESRVGKEWVCTCRSRWSPEH